MSNKSSGETEADGTRTHFENHPSRECEFLVVIITKLNFGAVKSLVLS